MVGVCQTKCSQQHADSSNHQLCQLHGQRFEFAEVAMVQQFKMALIVVLFPIVPGAKLNKP